MLIRRHCPSVATLEVSQDLPIPDIRTTIVSVGLSSSALISEVMYAPLFCLGIGAINILHSNGRSAKLFDGDHVARLFFRQNPRQLRGMAWINPSP